jgi:hypothetical protein
VTHKAPVDLVAGTYLPDSKDAKAISDKERKKTPRKRGRYFKNLL